MQPFLGKPGTDKRALIEQIILEKYNQYYRMAYSYTYNEDDAGDIVQNGAYKAIRSSHILKNPEFASTWVYRIMLNECFAYRRRPKHISYENMLEEGKINVEGTEDAYTDIDLRNAIDTLTKEDKAIIILKYFEDKTLEEIAIILDKNVNTIKSRLYRSIEKLHRILGVNEGLGGLK